MATNIVVLAEQRQGKLKKSVLEVLALARSLADGGAVHAVVLGKEVGSCASQVAACPVDKVWVADHPSLEFAQSELYVGLLQKVVDEVKPGLCLLTSSAMGRDLAPRLAARNKAALLTECISLARGAEGFAARKSLYGGKVYGTVASTAAAPLTVATVRPGAHAPAEAGGSSAEQAALAVEGSGDARARIVEVLQSEGETVDLQEAEIVVSGGRGLRGPENFHLIQELAGALGGAVGASRAVVDAGWIEHQHQVGQTGVTVSPKLYVAVGISGAIQHLAGMRSSGCIVAINKDPDAPIFKAADYGIVGDLFEVLPVLTEEVKKLKAS